MAYLKKLRTCDQSNCGRTATVEVMGVANESFGKYCDSHGRAQLVLVTDVEAKKWPRAVSDATGQP